MYKCSNCELAVIINEEETIKACSCDAPIIVELNSTLTGQGGVAV